MKKRLVKKLSNSNTTLNDETIERICSRIHFNKVFDQLGDLVEFSGHYLEHHLEPGKYNFSFTLFHYKDANVHSMANRALNIQPIF